MEKIPPTVSLKRLVTLLTSHGVNTAAWIKGKTKTPEDLLADIRSGAAEIVVYWDGRKKHVECHINSVVIDVICIWEGTSLVKLRENSRQLGDVRKAPRTSHSVSGKIHLNESPENAAIRCLREKFGITVPIAIVKNRGSESPLDAIRRLKRRKPSAGEGCILTKVHLYQLPEPRTKKTKTFPGLYTLRDLHLFACAMPDSLSKPECFTRRFGDKTITYKLVPFKKRTGMSLFEKQVH